MSQRERGGGGRVAWDAILSLVVLPFLFFSYMYIIYRSNSNTTHNSSGPTTLKHIEGGPDR